MKALFFITLLSISSGVLAIRPSNTPAASQLPELKECSCVDCAAKGACRFNPVSAPRTNIAAEKSHSSGRANASKTKRIRRD